MLRAIVSKRVIDRLLRARAEEMPECGGAQPKPVVWRERVGYACNWEIPGWEGEHSRIAQCRRTMGSYIQLLESQFDIPDEA